MSDWKIEKITICRATTRSVTTSFKTIDAHRLEIEETPSLSYLDLEISFGQRWETCRRLDLRTFTKPTAVKVPLSFDSGHRESCKLWWPLAEARRYARTCSSYADWKLQVRSLISRIPDYPRELHSRMLDPQIHLRRCVAVNGRARSGCVINDNIHVSQLRTRRASTNEDGHRDRSAFSSRRSVILKMRHNVIASRIGCMQVLDSNAFRLRQKFRFIMSWLNPDKHLRLVSRVSWPKNSTTNAIGI